MKDFYDVMEVPHPKATGGAKVSCGSIHSWTCMGNLGYSFWHAICVWIHGDCIHKEVKKSRK